MRLSAGGSVRSMAAAGAAAMMSAAAFTFANGNVTPIIAAGQQKGGEACVFATAGLELARFFPYGPEFKGGVRVAVGDVTGDGLPDIVTGAGPGGGPHVKAFSVAVPTQQPDTVGSFFAYDAAFRGGVFVAVGDLDGDRSAAEIVTGAGPGAGPHVKVFDGRTFDTKYSFLPFPPSFTGGVRVAAGDVNGDGTADIVVGQASGGSHVKIISGATSDTLASFFAFDPAFKGGVSVAVGDLDRDGFSDVIVGAGPGGGPHVKVFSGESSGTEEIESRFVYDPRFKGGVEVAAGNPVAALLLLPYIEQDNFALFLPAIGVSPASRGGVPTRWMVPKSLFPRLSLGEDFGFGGSFLFGPRYKGGVYLGMSPPLPYEIEDVF